MTRPGEIVADFRVVEGRGREPSTGADRRFGGRGRP